MNRDRWKKLMYGLTAALLLSACSQDELAENNTTLPEGEYPLLIGSVSLTAEVSEQPWTRVSENPTDGMSSEFQAGNAIGVNLNGETATYTYDGSAWTSETPLYWKDKQPATVTAWYPVEEEIDFTQQNVKGLTYLLKGTSNTDADFDTPANLTFAHQLAKVRVVLEGTKADEVQQVYVRSYPKSVNNQGDLGETTGGDPIYVPMMEATYNGQRCWEANLRKGYLDENNSFQVANADGVRVQVTQGRVNIEAGHVHTIKINVGEAQQVTGDISDDGTYIVSGTRTEPVTITGGNPTIYLENADISVNSGNAIDITGGSPTIHVMGENTENTIGTGGSLSNYAAGIYVAQGSSVTIEGSGTSDVLRVTGGADGAAIGGYSPALNSHNPCGDITIHNVTLYAYASNAYLNNLPIGIGSTGTASCGKIEITDAIVHARGYSSLNESTPSSLNESTPAIGAYSGVPQIVISGSTIHAHRGSYNNSCFADYIGRGGNTIEYQGGQIQCGSGSITGSTVYKYSYDVLTGSSSSDGSVTY